ALVTRRDDREAIGDQPFATLDDLRRQVLEAGIADEAADLEQVRRGAALIVTRRGWQHHAERLNLATTGPARLARDLTFGRMTGAQRPSSDNSFHSGVWCRFSRARKYSAE